MVPPGCVRKPHLSQMCELPFWYDGSSPQIVDVDVMWWCGHGGLQVVIVTERSSSHPNRKLHPTHSRTF